MSSWSLAMKLDIPNLYILKKQLEPSRTRKMMELNEEERRLIERIAPVLEDSLRYKIVRSIIDALLEKSYPPEEMLHEDLIKDVEEAEKDIKSGKGKRYTYDEFKRQFSAKAD